MIITEETAKLRISKEKKISKDLPVFYNPVMKLNRDVSVLLLNSISNKDMQMALPLAGSGIRGIRFLKELKKTKIRNISFNDYGSIRYIKSNLKLNDLQNNEKIILSNLDANLFLLKSKGFDYIDIDPFGSPNPFLDNSIVRISRGGILAVTATDTAALSGSSKDACIRKYWAKPLKNEFMHETAIRILIRKVQLMGAQNEKALYPIFSFSKDHYYRIFFKCEKGRLKVDKLLEEHKYLIYDWKTAKRKVVDDIFNKEKEYDYAGPLWIGKLWDEKLVKIMLRNCPNENKKLFNMLKLISEEVKINSVGFYDIHKMSQISKKDIPKIEDIINSKNTRTHFLGWGIRSKKR